MAEKKSILPKTIPSSARTYLFFAFLLFVFPSLADRYEGHTGKLLVSTSATRGTSFEQTVIYLKRHSFWDAHGIVINKPMDAEDVDISVFNGGPVGHRTTKQILLKSQAEPEFIEISKLTAEQNIPENRLYIGYAGWTVLQLNIEIVRGAWDIVDYDPDLLFETPSEDMWRKARGLVATKIPIKAPGA